jgi:hypothetical protein
VNSENGEDPGLLRIMVIGTTLGCAAMAASLEALHARTSGFYFVISWRTGGVFIGAAALALWGWKVMLDESNTPGKRWARRGAMTVLFASAVAAFLYPLRFVPKSKLPEIAIGLAMAVCALSIVGYLLLRARRFLESDEAEPPE